MNKVKNILNKIIAIIKKAFYIALYFVFRMLPLKDVIIFESEGDFTDNAQALYMYLLQQLLLKPLMPG